MPPVENMVTAYGREEVSLASKDVHIIGFLTKSITQKSLVDAILIATGK